MKTSKSWKYFLGHQRETFVAFAQFFGIAFVLKKVDEFESNKNFSLGGFFPLKCFIRLVGALQFCKIQSIKIIVTYIISILDFLLAYLFEFTLI